MLGVLRRVRLVLVLGAWCLAVGGWPISTYGANRIVKEKFTSVGQTRTYYLFVPDAAEKPAPLLVLLHGSGRDGRSLVERWEQFARKEGIILAGPDSWLKQGWGMLEDGPHFLYALVEALKTQHPIDPKRVYLFGHSAGAVHGLAMAVLESEYFAAVAVVVPADIGPFLARASRKIPIAIWNGTDDPRFPVADVQVTHKALVAAGFPAQLTLIPGHTHYYYGRASDINRSAWAFLETFQLAGEPKYQIYAVPR
jgi:poly(3-hydroxybutyrate) depolymerase